MIVLYPSSSLFSLSTTFSPPPCFLFFLLSPPTPLTPLSSSLLYKLVSPPSFHTGGYNHLDVVEYLLEKGADVNAKDRGGLIPLHNAASYGVRSCNLIATPICRSATCRSTTCRSTTCIETIDDNTWKGKFLYCEQLFGWRCMYHSLAKELRWNALQVCQSRGWVLFHERVHYGMSSLVFEISILFKLLTSHKSPLVNSYYIWESDQ